MRELLLPLVFAAFLSIVNIASSANTPIRVVTSGDVDFVVYPNAIEVIPYSNVNGVRTPIPDYQYKMTFEHAGTAGYGDDVFIFEPGNLFTLANIEPVITNTKRVSLDGTEYDRISVYYFLETLPSGKNHSLTFHYDFTEVETTVEYLGFRYPLRHNGMKFTSELQGVKNLSEAYYQVPANEKFPSVGYTIRLDLKGLWPYQVYVLDPESFPMRFDADVPIDFPRIDGFPTWDQYPRTSRTQNQLSEPVITRIRWEDPRVNVSFDFAAFSSSTFRFPWSGSTPTGQVPVYSAYAFYPDNYAYSKSLNQYLESGDANGDRIRGTNITVLYYTPLADSYGVGDTVIWDPDLSVVFGLDNDSAQETMNVVAIAVSLSVVGAVVLAVVVMLAVPGIRRKVFPFLTRKKAREESLVVLRKAEAQAQREQRWTKAAMPDPM